MPNAKCQMPNTKCQMPNATQFICQMPNATKHSSQAFIQPPGILTTRHSIKPKSSNKTSTLPSKKSTLPDWTPTPKASLLCQHCPTGLSLVRDPWLRCSGDFWRLLAPLHVVSKWQQQHTATHSSSINREDGKGERCNEVWPRHRSEWDTQPTPEMPSWKGNQENVNVVVRFVASLWISAAH